jgi:hypothetical protein
MTQCPLPQPAQLAFEQEVHALPADERNEPPLWCEKTLSARSTSAAPHLGQATFSERLNTSSSKACWQLGQTNS